MSNPHFSLAEVLTEHPEWTVTYNKDTCTYKAQRPLKEHHAAFGMLRDTVASRDTGHLLELIRVHDALREGIDYTNGDYSSAGARLAREAEQHANETGATMPPAPSSNHLVVNGALRPLDAEGTPSAGATHALRADTAGPLSITLTPQELSWIQSAHMEAKGAEIEFRVRTASGSSLGVRLTPNAGGVLEFLVLNDEGERE